MRVVGVDSMYDEAGTRTVRLWVVGGGVHDPGAPDSFMHMVLLTVHMLLSCGCNTT